MDFTPLQDAVSFASRAHRNHVRKDNQTPYAAHVFRVALTVRHVFGCEDQVALAASLLHDTIEDTTTDYDDLLERFGPEVADCVAALTKNMALPEHMREPEYDERLSRADWRARLIKLADQYDNYSDSVAGREGVTEKLLAKCRRALVLAVPDAEDHPETARAIAAMCELTGLSPGG